MKTLLLTLAMMVVAGPALACSCAPMSRAAVIEQSDAVFTGTVTDVRRNETGVTATFDVTDVLKGTVDERVEVTTGPHSAACGIDFKPGSSVEIAADRRGDTLHSNLCQQMGLGRNPTSK